MRFLEWDEVKHPHDILPTSISKPSLSRHNLPENKTLLINPNCYIKILIDYVREQVKFDFDCATLDFCNENGELLKVNEMKPYDYATNVMQAQKTYMIVKCVRNDEGIIKNIEPLLLKYSKEYNDVMPRLKKYRKHAERKKKASEEIIKSQKGSNRTTRKSSEDNIFRGSSLVSRGSRRNIPTTSSSRYIVGGKPKPMSAT